MNSLLLSVKKRLLIPVVLLLGAGVWLLLCEAHYKSYWDGTIYRVQTVDFNLLHHTLPPTLSQLIIAGRDDQVQKVLDSTYGLFGVVVTNPSGTSILYKTGKVYHRESWQHLAVPEYLAKITEPYDVLTEPPPLEAVYGHKSPRSAAPAVVGRAPEGRVLGRVYYVRPIPPTFGEDITGFFKTGALELSGAKRGYLYITASTVGFCLALVLLVLWRQRAVELQQVQLDHLRKDLEIRQKALEHLTSELLAQKARKEWLEKEADQAYRRALSLKEALSRLQGALSTGQIGSSPGGQSGPVRLRPPVHPPSAVLEEIEALIPELTQNASSLGAQAAQLQEHCEELERRQAEMKKIIDQVYLKASGFAGNVLQFRSK